MSNASRAARTLGRIKSPAKSAAARANGHLGGRPRIPRPCVECGSDTLNRCGLCKRPFCGGLDCAHLHLTPEQREEPWDGP